MNMTMEEQIQALKLLKSLRIETLRTGGLEELEEMDEEIAKTEVAIKNGVIFYKEEQFSEEVIGKAATATFLGWFDEVVITDNQTGKKVATFKMTEKIAKNKVEFAVDVFKMIENAIWAKKSLEQIGK